MVAQRVADTGVLITSEGSSADLKATTNADIGVTGTPPIASFAADFGLKESSGAINHEQFENGFTVAFRVLKLGERGWWWWKHIEVQVLVQ